MAAHWGVYGGWVMELNIEPQQLVQVLQSLVVASFTLIPYSVTTCIPTFTMKKAIGRTQLRAFIYLNKRMFFLTNKIRSQSLLHIVVTVDTTKLRHHLNWKFSAIQLHSPLMAFY